MSPKCAKCLGSTNVKDKDSVLRCSRCDIVVHVKFISTNDSLLDVLKNCNGLKWFCDSCVKLPFNLDSLLKSVDASRQDVLDKIDSKKNEMITRLEKLDDVNTQVRSEIISLKMLITSNENKLVDIDCTDTSIRHDIKSLKQEMSTTFASIVSKKVKKNTEIINNEVRTVQKMLTEVNEMKNRESNLMVFRLVVSGNDRTDVMKILQHLVEDISEKDVLKTTKLGKKK
ncbi:hypothetical protein HELRODRAFT_164974 [Helobdella robusta]|uniref:Zinc finger PHD-type domain-containing protein n=1 Tax=Helobdella robusta TaxID=6412 RepID=T1EW18_HELRO|nr:hypothetical protein HELRODRAFT_164974 [Helobdella robusta]ESN92844.1 hypothetical protein HELRODRAFT_164974 [Helobdella robusta]